MLRRINDLEYINVLLIELLSLSLLLLTYGLPKKGQAGLRGYVGKEMNE